MEVKDVFDEFDHFKEEAYYWYFFVKGCGDPKAAAQMATAMRDNHVFKFAKALQPDDVCQETRTRTQSIFENYTTLNQFLIRHEATIQKRWMKKPRERRLKILLQAWTGMATVHRPDMHAFRKESIEVWKFHGTKFRDHYVWPYINQEDLCKDKPLLLLLNSRGRNLPGNFASGDLNAMGLGFKLQVLRTDMLLGYFMLMDGPFTSDEYGKLVWYAIATEWPAVDHQKIRPGAGLLILEAQDKLLSFLVSCCQQILHDLPENAIFSDRFPIKIEPILRTDAEGNGFESLAVMAAEAPYRIPAKLDFDWIISLLSARLSAAKDRIMALREDPSYFA